MVGGIVRDSKVKEIVRDSIVKGRMTKGLSSKEEESK